MLKKVTFWTVLISLGICLLNYFGHDDKNILMFQFDPILYKAVYTEPFRSWMLSGEYLELTWLTYLLKICTGLLYGIVLDLLIYQIKRDS